MTKALMFSIAIMIFLGIYGGMHYYLYLKLIRVLPNWRVVIATVLVMLGGSIFIVEVFVHGNHATNFVSVLVWLSFIWMGLVYLFFVVSATLDMLGGLSARVGRQRLSSALASTRRTLWVMVVVVLLGVYGFYAAHQLKVERVSLHSAKIAQPLRIVQITDLHLGLMSVESYLKQVVNEVNRLDADIIVSTGDLVDMQLDHLERFKKYLLALQARHGKYAVYGNHEMLAGLESARAFTEQAGFTLLSNAGIRVRDSVTIVGVDDPGIGSSESRQPVSEAEILATFPVDSYRILLKHQPRVLDDAIAQFELQISGHTHGGQLFPFALITWLAYQQTHGLSQLDADSWLYVSRGTGTWGPPMRVLARPEITVFDIMPQHAD